MSNDRESTVIWLQTIPTYLDIKFQRISLITIGLNAIYITVINTTINRISIQFLSNQIAGTVKISGVKLLNHLFRGLK